jgi:hypothetical protein
MKLPDNNWNVHVKLATAATPWSTVRSASTTKQQHKSRRDSDALELQTVGQQSAEETKNPTGRLATSKPALQAPRARNAPTANTKRWRGERSAMSVCGVQVGRLKSTSHAGRSETGKRSRGMDQPAASGLVDSRLRSLSSLLAPKRRFPRRLPSEASAMESNCT